MSRLSRNLSDSLKLVEDISNLNVTFHSIKEGVYGPAHANLQFNILSSVAQYQRGELAENVKMGMTQRTREGRFNGGIVLGYKSVNKVLVIVEEEFVKVQLIEFLNLKNKLDVHEFRQLLVASIDRIDIENKSLKDITFSFISHIPNSENPSDSPLLKKAKV